MTAMASVEFEQIAQGFYLEALLIDDETIWYSDVALGGVRKLGSGDVLLPDRTMIGGLQLNRDGSLLISGAGGIAWANPGNGGAGMLLEGMSGVNEMRADSHGGLYFGTIDLDSILRGKRPSPSTIGYLSSGRDLTRLRDGLTFANGLSVSPDGATLYFNESFSATRAFPVGDDGSLGEPYTLIDLYDCDGMALDAEGNIWVTGFASSVLRCVRPDGSAVRQLALPGKACTNVRFGGADMRDLYVTIVDPASAQALAEGRPLEEPNSALFRTRSPVPGAAIPQTRFTL